MVKGKVSGAIDRVHTWVPSFPIVHISQLLAQMFILTKTTKKRVLFQNIPVILSQRILRDCSIWKYNRNLVDEGGGTGTIWSRKRKLRIVVGKPQYPADFGPACFGDRRDDDSAESGLSPAAHTLLTLRIRITNVSRSFFSLFDAYSKLFPDSKVLYDPSYLQWTQFLNIVQNERRFKRPNFE